MSSWISSWLRLIKTTDPLNRHGQWLLGDLLTLEAEAPPSAWVNCYFFRAHVSWRSQELGCICTRWWWPHLFPLSNYLSQCLLHLGFLPRALCVWQAERHAGLWTLAPQGLDCCALTTKPGLLAFEHSQALGRCWWSLPVAWRCAVFGFVGDVTVTWDVNEQPWGFLNMGAGSLGMTKHSANLGIWGLLFGTLCEQVCLS